MIAAELAERLSARKSGNGWIANCPGHEDRIPSLSIREGRNGCILVKCHAGCTLDEIVAAAGLIKKDLFTDSPPPKLRPKSRSTTSSFSWSKFVEAFTDADAQRLAKWRGFSLAFVKELLAAAMIGIYDGCFAFPVHSADKVIGCHYRASVRNDWFYYPTGIKTAPLVFGDPSRCDRLNVFESSWDALAFMNVSGERDGVIIARGTSNATLASALIPQGATAYVWTQNDKAGADFETTFVAQTKGTVKRPKVPAPHKDLNDWTRACASVQDLIGAITNAETLRETWLDSLNKSVVTSSQLETLRLKPRKKLLDDWMCEGDEGFIFAFRGVGKTWFALAIAQALSTGGGLGDWNAHEAVNVLYVDGEMPPDLMNNRASGLNKGNDHLFFLNHLILFDRSGRVLNITNRDVQESLTAYCLEHSIKVLILDNLSTLASGMKENEADAWEIVNTWLLDLRRRGVAVIIIHHAGRSGQMRGTSKREDNVFWIIALDDMKKTADDKRGACFISYFTKPSRNTQDEVASYQWHFVTESNGQVTISHKRAQSLDMFLRVIESGITKHDEIADAMKLAGYEVSRMAKKAEDQGWLTRPKRGEYCLTQKAKEMFADE